MIGIYYHFLSAFCLEYKGTEEFFTLFSCRPNVVSLIFLSWPRFAVSPTSLSSLNLVTSPGMILQRPFKTFRAEVDGLSQTT